VHTKSFWNNINHVRSLSSPWGRSHGSWIYSYLCIQCLSSLTMWVRILLMENCTRYIIIWYLSNNSLLNYWMFHVLSVAGSQECLCYFREQLQHKCYALYLILRGCCTEALFALIISVYHSDWYICPMVPMMLDIIKISFHLQYCSFISLFCNSALF
jgi:hypothetical protein